MINDFWCSGVLFWLSLQESSMLWGSQPWRLAWPSQPKEFFGTRFFLCQRKVFGTTSKEPGNTKVALCEQPLMWERDSAGKVFRWKRLVHFKKFLTVDAQGFQFHPTWTTTDLKPDEHNTYRCVFDFPVQRGTVLFKRGVESEVMTLPFQGVSDIHGYKCSMAPISSNRCRMIGGIAIAKQASFGGRRVKQWGSHRSLPLVPPSSKPSTHLASDRCSVIFSWHWAFLTALSSPKMALVSFSGPRRGL